LSRSTPTSSPEGTDDSEEDWEAEPGLFDSFTRPYLLGIGGFISVVLVAAMFVAIGPPLQSFLTAVGQPALAAEQSGNSSPASADRTSCQEIGNSDLRSPGEGLWFQDNCTAGVSEGSPTSGVCNRDALDPVGFTEISPGLHIFRQSWASSGYLWYAGSDGCYSLVSPRIVTVVCVDLTVSFEWDVGACSSHGGVLTWVNGP
jgi:hypothetical protein